jgi:hypothetical protein
MTRSLPQLASLLALVSSCVANEGRPADAPIGEDRQVAPPVVCKDGGCAEIDAALQDIIDEGGGDDSADEGPIAEPIPDVGGGAVGDSGDPAGEGDFVALPLDMSEFVDDTCFDEGCLEGACDAQGCGDTCNGGLGCGEDEGGSDSGDEGCGESGGDTDDAVQCAAPEDKAPSPGKPPEGAGYTVLDGGACKWLWDGYITKSAGGVCGLRRVQWGPDYVNSDYAKFIAKKCGDKPTVDKLKCISEQIRSWLGPFNKKGFVCRHNAVAFYWVLDALDMEGDAEVEVDKDYKHAWVSIAIDGVRYHIDPMNNCILKIDPKG